MDKMLEDYRKFYKSYAKSNHFVSNADGFIFDVYAKLFEKRIMFLTTDINDYSSNIIKAQLLYLNQVSSDDIKLYIDSGGGSIYTGMGILDTIDLMDCDVETVNIGICASMSAVILAYGTKGKRKALKRSRTMIHQPLGGSSGQASDIEIDAKQVIILKKELNQILADKTGKPIADITKDSDRDFWLTAPEAKKYGLIDEVIIKK